MGAGGVRVLGGGGRRSCSMTAWKGLVRVFPERDTHPSDLCWWEALVLAVRGSSYRAVVPAGCGKSGQKRMDPEVDDKPWVLKPGCACFASGRSEVGYASCAVQEERGAERNRREVDSVLQHHRFGHTRTRERVQTS